MSELRKMQRTAGGTFFVCLPKSWAQHYNLKRGGIIGISENADGKLTIDPKYGAEPSPKTVILVPGPLLEREIIANYLLGVDVIRVHGREQICLEDRESVKDTVSGLIGLEIVEEDRSGMVLQCLLEPSGFPPEKILRRAYAIAAGIDRDVVKRFFGRWSS